VNSQLLVPLIDFVKFCEPSDVASVLAVVPLD
jgi:hypothetical protein